MGRLIGRLLGGVLVVGALTVPATAHADDTVLDGVRVAAGEHTAQALVVNHLAGYRARVTWWTRTDDGWTLRARTDRGRIGYGGLVRAARRQQGTGTTPLGTFRLLWVFGRHRPDPDWQMRYRRIRPGDYWVQDNASRYYNRYRSKADGGFRWWLKPSRPNSSERLWSFRHQYEWAIVTSFNHRQVRHRGSGIFVHVNGSGATAGCVSAPRPFVRKIVSRLDPAEWPVVAIGR